MVRRLSTKLQRQYPEQLPEKDYIITSGLTYQILENNIGYIYCESFSDGIGDGNLDQMLKKLEICDGLIIDVRNNGGGNLTTAQKLAARFTNEKYWSATSVIKQGLAITISQPLNQYIRNRPTASAGRRRQWY